MTTNNTAYFRERAKESSRSTNSLVASLGTEMGYLCDEIEELRDELRRQHKLNATDSVERMLESLGRHFNCRVAPVEEYCKAFTDWVAACKVAAEEYDNTPVNERRSMPPLYDVNVGSIMLAIDKSSYLGRRIYGGEKHRTKKCPVHKGHWSGCGLPPACGCNLTGWLPDE